MSEMIERVARKIAKKNGDDYDHLPTSKQNWINQRGEFQGRHRDINEPFQSDYLEMARAAIEAMREPTEDVAAVMHDHASNGMVDWRELHEAMIDAALRSDKEGA